MFGRKKKSSEESSRVSETHKVQNTVRQESVPAGYTAPKGRPTPSRKEREAARRHPLVPADRKAAKEADRQAMREQRLKEQAAMQTGDERYLPVRDKGPQRRYIRDYIDARFNIGDYIIPVLFLIFIVGLFTRSFQIVSTFIMWMFILLWVLDTWFLWRKLKKKITEKFGSVEPGSAMYATNRVMMIRRFRLPKPQVRRGNYPQ